HDVVADLAIVRDVRSHHEKAVVADLGDKIAFCRSDIDRHIFADDAAAPDFELARKAGIRGYLRRLTNRCERKNLGIVADRSLTFYDDVLVQPDAAPTA